MSYSLTLWTAACQAPLSSTISQSLLKFMFTKSVMFSSFAVLFLLLPSISLSIRIFSNKLAFCIRWRKCWSFSSNISPSNEYSGLISFRIDWFDILAVQGRESSPAAQFESINSLALSLLYGPILTSIHDYWKNHSFDYMDLCHQSDVSRRIYWLEPSSAPQFWFYNFSLWALKSSLWVIFPCSREMPCI